MKAALFLGDGQLKLREMNEPVIKRSDDVLLKVEVASICGSDIKILEVPPAHPAKPGIVLGHEFVGEVVDMCSGVEGIQSGDRVVVLPDIPCGYCTFCQSGRPSMCINMRSLGVDVDGCFAEYVVVPAKSTYKISSDLVPEVAVFAEPLSCVVNALSKTKISPGQDGLILGAGPIGLYFLQLFKASGIGRTIVSELNKFRTDFAANLGADYIINPEKKNLVHEVQKLTDLGVDLCVDAVGSLLDVAINCVKRNGTVLLIGLDYSAKPCVQQSKVVEHDIRILGSFIAGYSVPETIKILEAGTLPLQQMITHRYSLHDINDGISAMKSGRGLEVLIYPHD